MEIFQTIWNSLITENVRLINILNIPLGILEVWIIMLIFTFILNISSTTKQKILYIIILSFIANITKLFISEPFNIFINVLSLPILVLIIFKADILKSFLAEIVPYALFVILGIIIQTILTIFTNLDLNNLSLIPLYKVISSLSLYLLAFTFYKLLVHYDLKFKFLDNININKNYSLIFNFVIGSIAIGFQLYFATIFMNFIPIELVIINILVFLVYFCISLYSLARTSKLEITTKNLEQEKLYNKTLTILHDNIRGFKHDFNNIVQAIGGYIATENLDGLKEYYSQLLGDCQKITNLTTLSPEVINNPPIFGILTDKYHKADEKGIKINLEIFMDLNTINMKIYEFTRMLGILLDNAIEASNECEEKLINIQIRKDNKSNRQLCIIENTYCNKEIDLDKIFEKCYTTKPNNSGIGLWEVRQILKKNNNLNLYTTKDNKFFKQQLEIYL